MGNLARLKDGRVGFIEHSILKCFYEKCVKRLVPGANVYENFLGHHEKGGIFLYHDGSGGRSTVHQNGDTAEHIPGGKASPQIFLPFFLKKKLQRSTFNHIHLAEERLVSACTGYAPCPYCSRVTFAHISFSSFSGQSGKNTHAGYRIKNLFLAGSF